MSDGSKIEWTEATWNPVTGCTKVSQGCKHCYALRDWARLSKAPHTVYFGREFTDVRCHPERLEQPLRWTKPRRIFVNSMSDLFHEDVPDAFIDEVFGVMALAPQHTFQVLTKRPERMREYLSYGYRAEAIGWAEKELFERVGKLPAGAYLGPTHRRLPLSNVWLGVSVEDQATADERIPLLLQTPAAVRWLSMEPLLGPVDIYNGDPDPRLGKYEHGVSALGEWWEPGDDLSGPPRRGVDWVVVGGESGPRARPMHPDWVRSLRDQCQAAGVPFFFKQWGEFAPLRAAAPDDAAFGQCEPVYGVSLHGASLHHSLIWDPAAVPFPEGMWWARRVGKKVAGRQLDGRTWDQYPEVRS